ncbi:MAG: hypothetical protein ACJAVY_000869 [Marinoscillum sp.]|jgi:hypothetical protein
MKNYLTSLTLLALSIVTLLSSCTDTCESTTSYKYFKPVYTSLEELRGSVSMEAPKAIDQSGKIYYINDHLLINEPNEGIHIVNNEDPTNPQNIGFISIPGNFDLAGMDGYLFVDSYVDLVILDISDLQHPKEVHRVEDIFPNYNSYGYYTQEEGIVTDWVEVVEQSEISTDCDQQGVGYQYYDWGYRYEGGIAVDMLQSSDASGGVPSSGSAGVGGSMARFTINNDHLFMIDQSEMRILDVSSPEEPILGARLQIGWGIETIFPYDDMLFIGANNGMYIYDVTSPLSPQLLSNYSHTTSCDPVVTDGKYAYVTLRSGNQCQGFSNQLEIIDIQDPTTPKLIETYPMYNPHGLSISGDHLFICDGEAGLKIYNASDVTQIDKNLIKNYGDIHAYDVIVIDCLLMLIGDDGLHQYSCNDFLGDITYLSSIDF